MLLVTFLGLALFQMPSLCTNRLGLFFSVWRNIVPNHNEIYVNVRETLKNIISFIGKGL